LYNDRDFMIDSITGNDTMTSNVVGSIHVVSKDHTFTGTDETPVAFMNGKFRPLPSRIAGLSKATSRRQAQLHPEVICPENAGLRISLYGPEAVEWTAAVRCHRIQRIYLRNQNML
jgi:hypothetical protein